MAADCGRERHVHVYNRRYFKRRIRTSEPLLLAGSFTFAALSSAFPGELFNEAGSRQSFSLAPLIGR